MKILLCRGVKLKGIYYNTPTVPMVEGIVCPEKTMAGFSGHTFYFYEDILWEIYLLNPQKERLRYSYL